VIHKDLRSRSVGSAIHLKSAEQWTATKSDNNFHDQMCICQKQEIKKKESSEVFVFVKHVPWNNFMLRIKLSVTRNKIRRLYFVFFSFKKRDHISGLLRVWDILRVFAKEMCRKRSPLFKKYIVQTPNNPNDYKHGCIPYQ